MPRAIEANPEAAMMLRMDPLQSELLLVVAACAVWRPFSEPPIARPGQMATFVATIGRGASIVEGGDATEPLLAGWLRQKFHRTMRRRATVPSA
jgi:hypothetical protein